MLAVEQTMLYPHPSGYGDHPYYTAAMQAVNPQSPLVFVDAAGKPWALRAGYDVSVFFPPEKMVRGRPDWLSLGGLRVPHYVSADDCQEHYPCLIEARYSDEAPDAIPADRVMLDLAPLEDSASHVRVYSSNQQLPSENLYLRPGKYQLSFSDDSGRVLRREDITVAASSP
jgi:hypothetical protein